MIKSNFELATRCGGVQIKGGSINFDMAGLNTFADALLKQNGGGQEAVAWGQIIDGEATQNFARDLAEKKLIEDMFNISCTRGESMQWKEYFTRPPIQSERELELLAEIEKLTVITKRYSARRHSIYQNRMRLQVDGARITEEEFNVEYDAACEGESNE